MHIIPLSSQFVVIGSCKLLLYLVGRVAQITLLLGTAALWQRNFDNILYLFINILFLLCISSHISEFLRSSPESWPYRNNLFKFCSYSRVRSPLLETCLNCSNMINTVRYHRSFKVSSGFMC